MKQMKVCFTGFGNATRPLIELLISEADRLAANCGVSFVIVGAADSKGAVVAPDGISAKALYQVRTETGSVCNTPVFGKPGMTSLEMIEACGADMLVEGLPANLPTGEPGFSNIRRAMELGMHVVTANKAPLALHGQVLPELAKKQGVMFRYGTAASAGLPSLEMGALLGRSDELLEMAGIFNATSQYILEGMRSGMSYEEALRGAQAGGFAEANPAADTEGWDTAMKTVIQANTYWNADFTLADVDRTGITGLTQEDIKKATEEGKSWCLVGRAAYGEGKRSISVKPECLPNDHPLAKGQWCDKILWFKTRTQGEQVHYCLGASASGTPGNTLLDMVAIARSL